MTAKAADHETDERVQLSCWIPAALKLLMDDVRLNDWGNQQIQHIVAVAIHELLSHRDMESWVKAHNRYRDFLKKHENE